MEEAIIKKWNRGICGLCQEKCNGEGYFHISCAEILWEKVKSERKIRDK